MGANIYKMNKTSLSNAFQYGIIKVLFIYGGEVMNKRKKGKGIISVLLICALCLTGLTNPGNPGTEKVKAAQKSYQVLIWSPVVHPDPNFYLRNIEQLESNYGTDLSTEETEIQVTMKYSTTQSNPKHFDGTENLAEEYDLVWVYLPYVGANEDDIKVLKEYVDAGGRLVLQGENAQNYKTENNNLTKLAESLGTSFSIDEEQAPVSGR